MPYRIAGLGYVEVRSLDLERDVDYYTNVLGLRLSANERAKVYMKGWDEHHSHSFILGQADRAGMVRMAFRVVDPEDLGYYERRLKEFGVRYESISEDFKRGRALRFASPSGHVVELYYDMEYTGGMLPQVNPDPWPLGTTGIAPPRIDHTLVTAAEPAKAIRFFEQVLEFRASEYVINKNGEPIAGFLRQRPAPHDIAIIPGRDGGLHHVAFIVESSDAIFRAADILSMNKAKIDYGPGRHGITRGMTIYFFDPSGNRLETFGNFSGYQPDPDMKPIHWTEDQIGTGIFYYERNLIDSFLSVYT